MFICLTLTEANSHVLLFFSICPLAKAILVCVVVLVRSFPDNRQRDLALTEGLHLLTISVSQSWLWKQSNSNKEYYTPALNIGSGTLGARLRTADKTTFIQWLGTI